MKRRTVLGGVGLAIGASVSGCLNSGGNDDDQGGQTSASPPWLKRVTMDVDEKEQTGRLVVHISKKADISEISLYKPGGALQTTTVVGSDQRRVGLIQVSVSTMPVSFYGFEPGTYELSALQGGETTDRQPFDVVRELSVEDVSLAFESTDGKEWVSGFQSSLTNQGLYPFLLQRFGPVDGVPNPPSEGEAGGAVPTEEDRNVVVWWNAPKAFREDRGDAAGPLVTPKESGTPDDALVDELTKERTATLAFTTTQGTTTVPVTYQLEGDLVTTPNGYAMSDGQVLSVDTGATPTATGDE